MRLNKALSFVFFILLSSIAIASDDAPPALPTEYWGNVTVDGSPAADGALVIGYVSGTNYGSAATTSGYYGILLAGGDKPLTYNDDKTCSTHYAAGQACVPCANTSDCIEGPQDSATILIKVNGSTATPSLNWLNGTTTLQNLVVVTTGIYNYTLSLLSGWNLVSIPIQPFDNQWDSIMNGCSYSSIWERQSGGGWCSTLTACLETVNITKGYWIKSNDNCTQIIEGLKQDSTLMSLENGWTLVGYPCIINQSLSSLIVNYTSIWERESGGGWCSTMTACLDKFHIGKGYWIKSDGTPYNVTC